MNETLRATAATAQAIFHIVSIVVILAVACLMAGLTTASALGYAPWLEWSVQFGDTLVPEAGRYVQGAVTALAVSLVFFLPANARVLRLENSHRQFFITMQDVSRAYHLAHEADRREGIFKTGSEFDSVRARLAYLRDHPDLGELEPSVLEVAAQMSHVSRDLAQIYSQENLQRAKDFLIQRQQEIETFNERLESAKAMAAEIRQWHAAVELEESIARSQLTRLREELADMLPELVAGTVLPAGADAPSTATEKTARALSHEARHADHQAEDTDFADTGSIDTCTIERTTPETDGIETGGAFLGRAVTGDATSSPRDCETSDSDASQTDPAKTGASKTVLSEPGLSKTGSSKSGPAETDPSEMGAGDQAAKVPTAPDDAAEGSTLPTDPEKVIEIAAQRAAE